MNFRCLTSDLNTGCNGKDAALDGVFPLSIEAKVPIRENSWKMFNLSSSQKSDTFNARW